MLNTHDTPEASQRCDWTGQEHELHFNTGQTSAFIDVNAVDLVLK